LSFYPNRLAGGETAKVGIMALLYLGSRSLGIKFEQCLDPMGSRGFPIVQTFIVALPFARYYCPHERGDWENRTIVNAVAMTFSVRYNDNTYVNLFLYFTKARVKWRQKDWRRYCFIAYRYGNIISLWRHFPYWTVEYWILPDYTVKVCDTIRDGKVLCGSTRFSRVVTTSEEETGWWGHKGKKIEKKTYFFSIFFCPCDLVFELF